VAGSIADHHLVAQEVQEARSLELRWRHHQRVVPNLARKSYPSAIEVIASYQRGESFGRPVVAIEPGR
jgi:hypothetical protein